MERAIHLMGETFYAKRNFPVLQVVDRHHALPLHERVFGCNARNSVHAAGGYHQLRPGRRESGAKRCHGFHYPDSVSNGGAVSIFR
jgi:hypothetical protein